MTEQYTQITEILHTIPKYGSGIGLHRTNAVLQELLGLDWHRRIPAIHITGSNGKGSTAGFTAALLTQMGFKTGLFTSPHFFAYNERFKVNGEIIPTPELYRLLKSGLDRIKQYETTHPDEKFGRFELLFITAMLYFTEQNVDAIVLEAGIGGRYDTTRLAQGSTAVLTSVDLEHAALLGNSLELIAYDKSDICPPEGKLIIGNVDETLRQKLVSYNTLRNVRIEFLTEIATIHNIDYTGLGMTASFAIDGIEFKNISYSMPGEHMVGNSILAIRAVQNFLQDQQKPAVPEALQTTVQSAFATLPANGRLEKLQDSPPLYIDTAHTPDAIRTLLKTSRDLFKDQVILVTGVSADKNVAPIVELLGSIANTVICTQARHKGSDPSKIQAIVKQAYPSLSCLTTPSVKEAIERAQEMASEHKNPVILVAGGLFLAVEAKAILEGKNPDDLLFF